MTYADAYYISLLLTIKMDGDEVSSRNHQTISHIALPPVAFSHTPLITVRKTAWKKAIREMEWFLSGDPTCPEDLRGWWRGQLNSGNQLVDGYGDQLRNFSFARRWTDDGDLELGGYDQLKFVLKALKSNPNSRRILWTTWNPGEMACITKTNQNPNTPTCCHNTMTQFFVREGKLFISTYQRSADMLLGVPHNWIQMWAVMLYLCHHTDLTPGHLRWSFGDAHIYTETSHVQTLDGLINGPSIQPASPGPVLIYKPAPTQNEVPPFLAQDFFIEQTIPEPKVTTRPRLL